MKYKGDYKQVHYAAFEENGKEFPAYCLTPQYNGVGTHGRDKYNVKITDNINNIIHNKLFFFIIHSYFLPYKRY